MHGRGPQLYCVTADLCDLAQVTLLQVVALVLFVTVVTSLCFLMANYL